MGSAVGVWSLMATPACDARPLGLTGSSLAGIKRRRCKLLSQAGRRTLAPAPGMRRGAVVVWAAQAGASPPEPAESLNEATRKDRRIVYTGDLWSRHRSDDRYARHLSTLPESAVLTSLFPTVAFLTAVAGALFYVNEYRPDLPDLMLPAQTVGPTSGFLSLLLVFRTNNSYDRWWEARKIWGGLLNRSRDFVVQGLTWFSKEDTALKEQLVRYTKAFAVALKVHLRGDEDMRTELTGILTEEELEVALGEAHVPNHLLQVLSKIITKADLDPYRTTTMSQNITFFEDVLGKCERILKTPLPLSYGRHLSRFLTIWLLLLPFASYKSLGGWVVPVEFFSALLLLGIEDIGVLIEEPFSVLSCEAICGSIAGNTTALLEQQDRDQEIITSRGGALASPATAPAAVTVQTAAPVEAPNSVAAAATAVVEVPDELVEELAEVTASIRSQIEELSAAPKAAAKEAGNGKKVADFWAADSEDDKAQIKQQVQDALLKKMASEKPQLPSDLYKL